MGTKPKTLGEAKAAGWTFGDQAWERGYISRKVDEDDAPLIAAGGSRKGQYYVLLPSWESTSYCIRQYLVAPKN